MTSELDVLRSEIAALERRYRQAKLAGAPVVGGTLVGLEYQKACAHYAAMMTELPQKIAEKKARASALEDSLSEGATYDNTLTGSLTHEQASDPVAYRAEQERRGAEYRRRHAVAPALSAAEQVKQDVLLNAMVALKGDLNFLPQLETAVRLSGSASSWTAYDRHYSKIEAQAKALVAQGAEIFIPAKLIREQAQMIKVTA